MATAAIPKLISVKEAALLLSLSPKTVGNWCSRRLIDHVRIGGSVRLKVEDVERLIEEGTTPRREI